MENPGKGVIYKAIWKSFIGNYFIGAALIFLIYLVSSRSGIGFNLIPEGLTEIIYSSIYYVMGGIATYLFLESFIEGILRRYIVSDHDIVKIEGIFLKRRHVIPYQSVAEVRVSKGIFGRIFNYGTVEIASFGESLVMKHMNDPEEIQKIIQHRMTRPGSRKQQNQDMVKYEGFDKVNENQDKAGRSE